MELVPNRFYRRVFFCYGGLTAFLIGYTGFSAVLGYYFGFGTSFVAGISFAVTGLFFTTYGNFIKSAGCSGLVFCEESLGGSILFSFLIGLSSFLSSFFFSGYFPFNFFISATLYLEKAG